MSFIKSLLGADFDTPGKYLKSLVGVDVDSPTPFKDFFKGLIGYSS